MQGALLKVQLKVMKYQETSSFLCVFLSDDSADEAAATGYTFSVYTVRLESLQQLVDGQDVLEEVPVPSNIWEHVHHYVICGSHLGKVQNFGHGQDQYS